MKTMIIAVENLEDGIITRAEKRIPEDEYLAFPWSTWAEVLYLTFQDLNHEIDKTDQ